MEVKTLDRDQMKFTLEFMHCLKGGTKEACLKVRNFIQTAAPIGQTIQSPQSCVRPDEFIEAVMVLLADCSQHEDRLPKTWHCDNTCVHTSAFLCEGECSVNPRAPELCPFYVEEDK